MKNWKTTILGVLTLMATAWKIFTTGAVDTQDTAAIAAGVGLITAKDSNVTGGKVQQ